MKEYYLEPNGKDFVFKNTDCIRAKRLLETKPSDSYFTQIGIDFTKYLDFDLNTEETLSSQIIQYLSQFKINSSIDSIGSVVTYDSSRGKSLSIEIKIEEEVLDANFS
ncbi:MAG: hypothetical protein ACRCYP_05280 [Alphaproteobacteria bacterium]